MNESRKKLYQLCWERRRASPSVVKSADSGQGTAAGGTATASQGAGNESRTWKMICGIPEKGVERVGEGDKPPGSGGKLPPRIRTRIPNKTGYPFLCGWHESTGPTCESTFRELEELNFHVMRQVTPPGSHGSRAQRRFLSLIEWRGYRYLVRRHNLPPGHRLIREFYRR